MGINENVKVSKYEKIRAQKHIDPDGRYPALSRLVTEALKEKNDKLDAETKK